MNLTFAQPVVSFTLLGQAISIWFSQLLIGFVLIQRLVELRLAERNTERLLAAGGVEHGAAHYPYIVIMHAAWIAALVLLPETTAPVNLAWLAAFAVLQVARLWVMLTLRAHFTTRIITAPGMRLVRTGPYRYVRHPNYLVVIGEIAVLPLFFGLWQVAAIFSILNAIALSERIKAENAALAEYRGLH